LDSAVILAEARLADVNTLFLFTHKKSQLYCY